MRLDGVASGLVRGQLDVVPLLGGGELEGGDPIRVMPSELAAGPHRHPGPFLGRLPADPQLDEQVRQIRLVQGAGDADQIAEVPHDHVAVAGEQLGCRAVLPAALPSSQRGEVKWWKVTIGRRPCAWQVISMSR